MCSSFHGVCGFCPHTLATFLLWLWQGWVGSAPIQNPPSALIPLHVLQQPLCRSQHITNEGPGGSGKGPQESCSFACFTLVWGFPGCPSNRDTHSSRLSVERDCFAALLSHLQSFAHPELLVSTHSWSMYGQGVLRSHPFLLPVCWCLLSILERCLSVTAD